MAKAAVIRTGGKQYRVSEGETLSVELLTGKPGDTVEFTDVLMIAGDEPKFGKPTVSGAKVSAEIVGETTGPKVVSFKFRRRKRSHQKIGHKQHYTAVKITAISG